MLKKAQDNGSKKRKITPSENTLLTASVEAVKTGINKGISLDLSKSQDSSAIFNFINELIIAPIALTAPGRELERSIKNSGGITTPKEKINAEARNRFYKSVINPSKSLYRSSFVSFINIMKKLNGEVEGIELGKENDITNIKKLIIDYNDADDSTTNLSQYSPYKIIIKQLIPMLREKFGAIESFRNSLDNASYEVLASLYQAIQEWYGILNEFGSAPTVESSYRGDKAKGSQKSDSDKDSDDNKETATTFSIDGLRIAHVDNGSYTYLDSKEKNVIFFNQQAILNDDTPVVKIILKGRGADKVNTVGSGEDYIEALVDRGDIVLPRDTSIIDLFQDIQRETVKEGAQLSLYFRPVVIMGLNRASQGRAEVMQILPRNKNGITLVSDDSGVSQLGKTSSLQTTSYYETKSPSGETVFFTPTDLVRSGGRLKDSRGKSFKPKKIKGKSLASKVMSKGFGKVKKK